MKGRAALTFCARCLLGALLLPSLLVACAVVESQRIVLDVPPPGYAAAAFAPSNCDSTLGSYALPRAFLRIRIGQKADKLTPPDISVAKIGDPPVDVVRRPDPSLVFCLDHLASVFTKDTVKIIKWPAAGAPSDKSAFLGAVSFNLVDRTAYIVEALVRSFFIIASGEAGFAPRSGEFAPNEIVGDFEFDPFDPIESATVNARLAALGFCVVLENFTFAPEVGVQRYCDAPLTYGARPTLIAKAYLKAETVAADPHLPGLLYRPRHPYRVSIFRKQDPRGRGRWQLSYMANVNLENLSPVLSLGVTRAAFAGKNVNFVFDTGTLVHACVSKTSEIEGFVDIPLQISKSLVDLPASIAMVRIGDVKNEAALLQAQQRLYAMQEAYLRALADPAAAKVPADTPTAQKGPAPVGPGDFGMPSGLAGDPVALPYGTSLLFEQDLKKVCEGAKT